MKYTKDNILGISFDIDTCHYLVKEVNGVISLWGASLKGIYDINCGWGAETIANNLNINFWKQKNLKLPYYEIY